jgi:hypothetical protein
MSRLVDELIARGLRVPKENRPLAEIEPGRIDDMRKRLPVDMTQKDFVENKLGMSQRTFQDWNKNPGQIKSDDAAELVDRFTKQFMTSYAITENVARSLVLDELTKDVDRQETDAAYIRGMSCILSSAADYLLTDELEPFCALVAQVIKAARQEQIAQDDLRAFLEVINKWDYMRRRKNGDTEGYREAGKSLDSAIAAFSSLTEKAPDTQ